MCTPAQSRGVYRLGWSPYTPEGDNMVTILIVLVVLMLLGVIPAWPHSRGWGYQRGWLLLLIVQ
jgi:hypothetical protein